MKADLQLDRRPHPLRRGVALSPSSRAAGGHAYGTAARASKRVWPLWHHVYCTSIWSWCILKCKQGQEMRCTFVPSCTQCPAPSAYQLLRKRHGVLTPHARSLQVCTLSPHRCTSTNGAIKACQWNVTAKWWLIYQLSTSKPDEMTSMIGISGWRSALVLGYGRILERQLHADF